MKKTLSYMMGLLLILSISNFLPAEEKLELKIPHKFQAGKPAKASEVNDNFNALREAIQQLQQENCDLRETLNEQKTQLELLPKTILGLDDQWHPLLYTTNKFQVQDNVVIDHATGLMWQQAGSSEELSMKDALSYIVSLNDENFGGHNDWRLPHIQELMTLLTSKKHSNDMYIDPRFDETQRWCLSTSLYLYDIAWSINIEAGNVYRDKVYRNDYVRAVRSMQ